MFKAASILLLVMAFFANESTADPIKCGGIPLEKVFECIGSPALSSASAVKNCPKDGPECEMTNCYAREDGWLVGDKLDKTKIIADLDALAKSSPEWSSAIEKTKADCVTKDLAPQGTYLTCPTYDIYMCTIGAMAKYASPDQWSSKPDCQTAKTYATACPACPEECYAAEIPAGSCNACNFPPKSA